MTESQYHRLADALLERWADALEAADADGALDVECNASVLTITVEATGKQYLVSKHAPTKQIWVSSPLSGGLHFFHDGVQWKLADGRELAEVATGELETLAGIKVVL